MRVSMIGGGAWGSTLAQVLSDNENEVLIYDINKDFVKEINESHTHPFFINHKLPDNIKASSDLLEAVNFGELLVLCVPTKVTRIVCKQINELLNEPKSFVNVSKGIEPDTEKRVSEIVYEEINNSLIKGFAALTGPSHAEEVIERKITTLVSASKDIEYAKKIQLVFNNNTYLRVYTSDDLIGCEIGGAIKNAIAVVSGISTGLGLGENARAALISRGVLEIVKITKALGGKESTAFGLAGIGDLIVTASSENSRNFRAGRKIGLGEDVEEVVNNSVQTVEGVRTVLAAYEIGKRHNLSLPIINAAYEVLYNKLNPNEAVLSLLSRELKQE